MKKKVRIVFISHDASLSGAPILLLNLIRLIKNSGEYNIHIIVKRSGYFNLSFLDTCPTIFLKSSDYLLTNNFIKKIFQVVLNRIKLFNSIILCAKADVIFSNTITNGRLLKILSITKKPVITYVHELKSAAQLFDLHHDASYTVKYSDFFLYPSDVVSNFLFSEYGVSSKKKRSLPYYFPIDTKIGDMNKQVAKREFANKYNIEAENLFVVGMGNASIRKGIDYFLDTAEIIVRQKRKISFIWIGRCESIEIENYVDDRLKEINSPNIVFTGAMSPDIRNLIPFDIFFLSSREDPYPLVVLEAASLAIPTICFANSGGIIDFIQNDSGWIINNFSPTSAAEAIDRVNNDDIIKKGEKAKMKVLDKHFNSNAILETFRSIIDELIV
jgi:glycosyltransferase involved in cell wall biosynthesis